jgi:hypothetical protein
MEKIFATDDHTALLEAAGGRAFHFYERADKITKMASDAIGRQDIQMHMPPDDHFGVHLITMGAEETFGPNRNGDSASVASLTNHHPTFEKYGCVYREHRNRDPRREGIGMVKLARFNPAMSRGELLVWVSKEKAPDMYKAAKDGEELSWSMSMRLPHDECSCCRKKSARVDLYCDHLKNSMLKYLPGFEKYAYARNEEGVKFFDISEVKRRADRIATYLGYFGDSLQKAAAAAGEETVISGAQWAQFFGASDHAQPFTPWEEGTMQKLAEAIDYVRHAAPEVANTLFAMAPADLPEAWMEDAAGPDFRSLGGELAKAGMFVNFPTFCALITGDRLDDLQKDAGFIDAAGLRLPAIIGRLLGGGGLLGCGAAGGGVISSVSPDECGCSFSPKKDIIDKMMLEVGGGLSMRPEEAKDRALRVTVIKSASAPPPPAPDTFYTAAAEAYCHYLVKAAHIAKDAPGVDPDLMFLGLAASLLKNAA